MGEFMRFYNQVISDGSLQGIIFGVDAYV